MAIDPTGAGLKAFLAEAPDEPVVMLNLLRFADGGEARYAEYLAHFTPHAERRGAEVLRQVTGLTERRLARMATRRITSLYG